MRLTRVTITGADDAVPHIALRDLSEEFPFVEFGILLSRGRFGEHRYPSTKWLMGLEVAGLVPRCSYHMCGGHARRIMGGDPTLVPHSIKRMQLNGFSQYHLPCLLAAEGAPEVEFILQCNTYAALKHALYLREGKTNVVALWDPSGGEGKSFVDNLPFPRAAEFEIPMGYAGGIDEHNVEDVIAMLCSGAGDPLWIDLESGARTDDEFDVDKVRRILKLAAPSVVP